MSDLARVVKTELDTLRRLKAGLHRASVVDDSPLTVHLDGIAQDVPAKGIDGQTIAPGDTGLALWQPPLLLFIKTA